jgi:hypothetical protein
MRFPVTSRAVKGSLHLGIELYTESICIFSHCDLLENIRRTGPPEKSASAVFSINATEEVVVNEVHSRHATDGIIEKRLISGTV